MSGTWSAWVMGLIVLNLGITLLLFLWAPRVEIPTQPDGTSGHVWAHGVLREGIRRLPTWWIVLSAAMFVIGFSYLALYPGFGNFAGVLGWTSGGELARDTDANRQRRAELLARAEQSSVEELARDPAARRAGEILFVDNCAACHGRDARGNRAVGAPDLTDGDWLWGGDGKAILASILDGRRGAMPAFASTFGAEAMGDLVQYVLSLSGLPHDGLRAQLGKPSFAACAACHGADGKGNPALGAPNLTDATWLYGGNAADVLETVRSGRSGVMPAWRGRLSDSDARLVAAWVYAKSHADAAPRP